MTISGLEYARENPKRKVIEEKNDEYVTSVNPRKRLQIAVRVTAMNQMG